jgi:hypothetical protein
MDLLRIDHRTVNLDRLTMVVERADPQGGSPLVELVFGEATVVLSAPQSEAFRRHLDANYLVRELEPPAPTGSRGRVVAGRGADTAILPSESVDPGG